MEAEIYACRGCALQGPAEKRKPTEAPGSYEDVTGHELIDDIVLVDQSPIGKPPVPTL